MLGCKFEASVVIFCTGSFNKLMITKLHVKCSYSVTVDLLEYCGVRIEFCSGKKWAEGQPIQVLFLSAIGNWCSKPSPSLWNMYLKCMSPEVPLHFKRLLFQSDFHMALYQVKIYKYNSLAKDFKLNWAINLGEIRMVGSGTPGRMTSFNGTKGIIFNPAQGSEHWLM